jgi:hypothetical protein
VNDLDKMRMEFPEIYEQLYTDGNSQFTGIKKKKKHAFKECFEEEIKKQQEKGGFNLLMRPMAQINSTDED